MYIKTKCNKCGIIIHSHIEKCDEEIDGDYCGGEHHEMIPEGFILVDTNDLAYLFNQSTLNENYRNFSKERMIKNKYLTSDENGRYKTEAVGEILIWESIKKDILDYLKEKAEFYDKEDGDRYDAGLFMRYLEAIDAINSLKGYK